MLTLLIITGCTANRAYSQEEIYQIVDNALSKGELANLLFLGEFEMPNEIELTTENGLTYSYIQHSNQLPLPTKGDIWTLLQSFSSNDDIKAYMNNTFINTLSEQYLSQMITDEGNKYEFQNKQILQCRYLATYPISLINWQHQPLEITINQKNKIQVMLKGEFILTGTDTTLPLTLIKKDDQWLLDESFSPQEQKTEDYYYSQKELQNILDSTLIKANKANKLYAADNFKITDDSFNGLFANNKIYYGLIDKQNQYNQYYEVLAKEFTNTASIKKLYNETFVEDLAQFYLDNLFLAEAPVYLDLPEGLAYKLNIACMPITLLEWQSEDYIVWLNTENEIMVIMGAEYPNFDYGYYPLHLQFINEKWLCDETYETSIFSLKWYIAK